MTRRLLKLPWFVSSPTLVVIAAVFAFGANYIFSSYFERTFLNEADPLAASAAGPAGVGETNPPKADASGPAALAGDPRPPVAEATGPAVLASGILRSGDPGHHGSGGAKIIRGADGKLVLRFENFSVTNGPDLFVILSTDAKGSRSSAADGLNLGKNRATDGNVNYEIPAGTDVSKYHSAIIYCREFRIVFAFAALEAAS